jgi:hypothetical protein
VTAELTSHVVSTSLGSKSYLGVVASACFAVSRRGEVSLTHDAAASEPEHSAPLWLSDAPALSLLKPLTDVILRGRAHGRRRLVTCLETGVRVGPVEKKVRVHGRRLIHAVGKRLAFTEPETIDSVPLAWSEAYGGSDPPTKARGWRVQEGESRAVYPRNPMGRGFATVAHAGNLIGTDAPSVDDPGDPVLPERLIAFDEDDWPDRPVAASYDAVDVLMFPRSAYLAPPDLRGARHPLRERAVSASVPDEARRDEIMICDAGVFNSASTGLATARLCGGERVSAWNLHPLHELWEFRLPVRRPRLAVEPVGCGVRTLEAQLQTVLLEPDADRVTLTWAGSIEVAAPFPEGVCEQLGRQATLA